MAREITEKERQTLAAIKKADAPNILDKFRKMEPLAEEWRGVGPGADATSNNEEK